MAEEKKQESGTDNFFNKNVSRVRENPWIAVSAVLGVLLVVSLFLGGGITGNAVSESDIGEIAVDFINTQLLQGQGEVTLDSVNVQNGLYEVNVNFNGKVVPTYFTKDGQNFIDGQLVSLTGAAVSDADAGQSGAPAVPKSAKPIAELFVMTHCPYGLQAEKGIISAFEALGSKIDGKIRFVHYFMHGEQEEQETYRQICIREEQSSKFLDYLQCFAESGDSDKCLTSAGIDTAKLTSCTSSTGNAKKYYAEDSELSQGYGVQGSPTLVINGVQSGAGRDSASYLAGICAAFSDASKPSECSQALSSAAPSPGFGAETASGSASTASCG